MKEKESPLKWVQCKWCVIVRIWRYYGRTTHIDEMWERKQKGNPWHGIKLPAPCTPCTNSLESVPKKNGKTKSNVRYRWTQPLTDRNPQTHKQRLYKRSRFLCQPFFPPLRLYVSRLDISEKYKNQQTTGGTIVATATTMMTTTINRIALQEN